VHIPNSPNPRIPTQSPKKATAAATIPTQKKEASPFSFLPCPRWPFSLSLTLARPIIPASGSSSKDTPAAISLTASSISPSSKYSAISANAELLANSSFVSMVSLCLS